MPMKSETVVISHAVTAISGLYRRYVRTSWPMFVALSVFLLFCRMPCAAVSATVCGGMPFIAYMGPVVESVSVTEYSDMARCGFTHSINIYNTLEHAIADIGRAGRAGIRLFVHTPQIIDNPAASARKLRSYKMLAGYFLADEPGIDAIPSLRSKVAAIKQIDPIHPCYVNLHPYYDANQLRSYGAGSYRQYLQTASSMGLPQLSFDYYPVTVSGLRPTWFLNLEEVRGESLRCNIPFWGYVLTVPHNDYPVPTLAAMRLQAYVNLAYGAQAIEFFTYRTPDDKTYDFGDAMIGRDGRKTGIYTLAKTLMSELRPVANLFYGAKVLSVGHLIKIPQGAVKASTPVNLKRVVATGRKGAVVSVFTKAGHTYMAVVNKDYEQSMTLRIEPKSASVVRLDKSLRAVRLKASYTVGAGDMALFKLI